MLSNHVEDLILGIPLLLWSFWSQLQTFDKCLFLLLRVLVIVIGVGLVGSIVILDLQLLEGLLLEVVLHDCGDWLLELTELYLQLNLLFVEILHDGLYLEVEIRSREEDCGSVQLLLLEHLF
jgi:hypothetical protein